MPFNQITNLSTKTVHEKQHRLHYVQGTYHHPVNGLYIYFVHHIILCLSLHTKTELQYTLK